MPVVIIDELDGDDVGLSIDDPLEVPCLEELVRTVSEEVSRPGQLPDTVLGMVQARLDTVGQIEAHLVSRRYEGFSGTGRVRGRLGR